ncbi:MAG: hypothetical protein LKJ75_02615 [Clostridia bacterium]|jgi:hypothetical protein|nr:hypothetical protein [Clostridia bacterium]MCI2014077.1 hypothetical protein [Clostridia bacterium]
MFYAEINSNNICSSVLETPNEITKDTMIQIDSYDASLLGKKYNNGTWEDVTDTVKEPTDDELFQAEALLNQQNIIIKQNEHDEVLAQILLDQQS